MAEPTFSVIVPVYNAEQYLLECIKSILNQSFPDFELILVDDGSQDATGDICDKYANSDSRVTVIHKKNAGVSEARNDGLGVAKGKFVCFVDADDWISAEYFERTLAELENVDILFFSFIYHYEDGCVRSLIFPKTLCRHDISRAIQHLLYNDTNVNCFGYTWNKIFRKDIIDRHEIRFVKGVSVSEDEVFTVAYCNHVDSLKVIDVPLYHYRWKSQGLTHGKKRQKDWLLLVDSFWDVLAETKNKALVEVYKGRIAQFIKEAARTSNVKLCRSVKKRWLMFRYYKQRLR